MPGIVCGFIQELRTVLCEKFGAAPGAALTISEDCRARIVRMAMRGSKKHQELGEAIWGKQFAAKLAAA